VLRGHKGFRLTKEEVRDGLKYEDITRGLGFINGRLNWVNVEASSPPLLQLPLPPAEIVSVKTNTPVLEVVPMAERPTSGPDPPSSLDDPCHASKISNGMDSRSPSTSWLSFPSPPDSYHTTPPPSPVPSPLPRPHDRTTPAPSPIPSVPAAETTSYPMYPGDMYNHFKKLLEAKEMLARNSESVRAADENGSVSGPGPTAAGDAPPAAADESLPSSVSRHPSHGADQGGDEDSRSDGPEIGGGATPIKIPLGHETGPEKADQRDIEAVALPSQFLSNGGNAQEEQAKRLSLPRDDVEMDVMEPASSSRASSVLSVPAYLAPLAEPAQLSASLSLPRDDVEMEVVDPGVSSTPSEPTYFALLQELTKLNGSKNPGVARGGDAEPPVEQPAEINTEKITLDLEEQNVDAAAVAPAGSSNGSLMSLETEQDEEVDENSPEGSGSSKSGEEKEDYGNDGDVEMNDLAMGMAEPKSRRSSHENGGGGGGSPSASSSRRISPAARSRSRSLSGLSDTTPTSSTGGEHFMLSAAAWTSEPESVDASYSDSAATAKAGPVQPPPLPSPVLLHAEPRSASCYSSGSRRKQNYRGVAAAMRRYGTAPLGNFGQGGGGYGEEGEDEDGMGHDPVVTKIVSVFRDTLEGLTDILTTVGSGREDSVCSPALTSSISRKRGSMPVPPPPPPGPTRSMTPVASTSTMPPPPQPPSTEAQLIGELLVEIKSLQRTMQEDARRRTARDLEMQRMQTDMDDLRRQVLRIDRERHMSSGSGITEQQQHAPSPTSPLTPSTFSSLPHASSSALLPAQMSSPHPLSHLLAMDVDMAPAENGLSMSRDSTFVSSPSADSDSNGPLGDLQYPFAPGPILPSSVRAPSRSPAPLGPAHRVYSSPDLTLIPPLDVPLPIKSQRKQRGGMFMAHPLRTVDNT